MYTTKDLRDYDRGDTDAMLDWAANEIDRLQKDLADIQVKEGPLNAERWTLDALITKMEEWRAIASGKTCVSFENLCFGASSLWHQSHREGFRQVDRKPEALGRWILETEGSVKNDFPAQVLAVLIRLTAEIDRLQAIVDRLPKDADENPIFPGDFGFAVRRPVLGGSAHVTEFKVDAVEKEWIRNWQVGIAKPSEFYRTREAAEKAKQVQKS